MHLLNSANCLSIQFSSACTKQKEKYSWLPVDKTWTTTRAVFGLAYEFAVRFYGSPCYYVAIVKGYSQVASEFGRPDSVEWIVQLVASEITNIQLFTEVEVNSTC